MCVLKAIESTIADAVQQTRLDPQTAFGEVTIGNSKKKATRVDMGAEDNFVRYLRSAKRGKFNDIKVFGEERTTRIETSGSVVALVDMIDGSDLFERGLSNWCSAVLLFDPRRSAGSRILAAFVGIAEPSLKIYHARHGGEKAWVYRRKISRPVAGPSQVKRLQDASLCFYGQKAGRLHSFANTPLLQSLALGDSSFRIYNLAGNPMLVRLVDTGVGEAPKGIDAVVEIGKGQMAHDFVAGAYVARKGGAHLVNLEGKELTDELLEEILLKPGARSTYVAAATRELAQEIIQLNRGTGERLS